MCFGWFAFIAIMSHLFPINRDDSLSYFKMSIDFQESSKVTPIVKTKKQAVFERAHLL